MFDVGMVVVIEREWRNSRARKEQGNTFLVFQYELRGCLQKNESATHLKGRGKEEGVSARSPRRRGRGGGGRRRRGRGASHLAVGRHLIRDEGRRRCERDKR